MGCAHSFGVEVSDPPLTDGLGGARGDKNKSDWPSSPTCSAESLVCWELSLFWTNRWLVLHSGGTKMLPLWKAEYLGSAGFHLDLQQSHRPHPKTCIQGDGSGVRDS